MLYILTGNGKGKTTCAVGMGVRAAGAGRKVLMVQFLKKGDSSEGKIIKEIKNFDIKSFGRKGFFLPPALLEKHPELKKKGVKPFSKEDSKLVREALEFTKENLEKEKYNFLILDEINLVLYFGLLEKKEVWDFLKRYKNKIDIVLTGRYCPEEFLRIADLATEFKSLKHYYEKGKRARKGIEY